jgi:hypothetical protein
MLRAKHFGAELCSFAADHRIAKERWEVRIRFAPGLTILGGRAEGLAPFRWFSKFIANESRDKALSLRALDVG